MTKGSNYEAPPKVVPELWRIPHLTHLSVPAPLPRRRRPSHTSSDDCRLTTGRNKTSELPWTKSHGVFFSYESLLQYSTTVRPSDDTMKKIPFSRLSNQTISNHFESSNRALTNKLSTLSKGIRTTLHPCTTRDAMYGANNINSLKNTSNLSSNKLQS